MKKFISALILSLVAMAAVSSCDETVAPADPYLVVFPQTVDIDAAGEAVIREIAVETNVEWEIASSPEWITIEGDSKTGFIMKMEPYTEGDNDLREGVVVVEAGTKREEVTVTQELFILLGVSPLKLQIGATYDVVSRKINVEAADAWEITSTPEWISTRDITETSFSMDIQPYIDGADAFREGTIVVEMGDKTREIAVKQLVYIIPVVLELSKDSFTDVWAGVEYGVSVTASHLWEVDAEVSWLNITDVTETGFNIVPADYGDLQDESRTGKVVVTMKDPGATKREVTVVQPKPIPGAAPLAGYMGEYTVIGQTRGGGSYQRTATMRIRTDIGDNIISINAVSGAAEDVCFKYDPATGVLYNYNHKYDPYRGVTMAFYLEFRRLFEIQTGYFPIPEGEVMLTFNDEGEIVTPSMIWIEPATSGVHQEYSDFDPGEKTVYLLDCFYTTGFYVGSTIITDVKLKKN